MLTSLLLAQLLVAQSSPVERAIEAELEVLKAEQSQLQSALAEAEANAAAAKNALQDELTQLTEQLVRLRAENADAAQQLPASERLHRAEDQERQLEELEAQIRSVVGAKPDTPLADVFGRVVAQLETAAGLKITSRSWFDREGREQRGDVLTLGQVAAVTWDQAHAALVRLDSGEWWAVPQPDGGGSQLTSQGTAVSVVLFDPQEPPTLGGFKGQSFAQWIRAGGFTMWPLLILALIAVLVAMERIYALVAARMAISTVIKDRKTIASKVWLRRVQDAVSQSETQLMDALDAARESLFRGLSFLSLTAGVAPLLGLLGTVTGMIGTFDVITEHGTGDPQLLSGGISEALITTQLGLIVAVFALLLQAALRRLALSQLGRLELAVMDDLQREVE